MRKNQKKIILVIILISLIAVFGKRFYSKTDAPEMKFYKTELTNIDSNEKLTINALQGNVLIVSCYQTWCGDCARETPILNQLATNLNSDKFKIIYISDEPTEKVTKFRNKFKSDKIIFTYSTQSLKSLGIKVYPTTYLLNKKGEVIKTKLEGYDWLKDEQAIKQLLGE